MSLFSELVDIYDKNTNQIGKIEKNSVSLLPISHITVKIPLQINLDKNGKFLGAEAIDKDEQKTIVPTTIKSASRSSGICPMPVDDKLKYVAADYYLWSKKDKDKEYYKQYINQLKKFNDYVTQNCNVNVKTAIHAIYQYLTHAKVLHDLNSKGIFGNQTIFENIPKKWTGKNKPKVYKEATGSPLDSFVRFNVRGVNEKPRWQDKEMFDAWIEYYNTVLDKESTGVDYISGKSNMALTQMHPKGILPVASNAKLISANDNTNYTFRGRFLNADEAATISYEDSQKANLALKWLIEKQSFSVGGRYYVGWGARNFSKDISSNSENQELLAQLFQIDISVDDGDTNSVLTEKIKNELLKGKEENLEDLVHVLELDTSTPGRIDIVYYQTIDLKEYIDKLSNWYSKTFIDHLSSKYKFKNTGLWQIASMVHGEHAKDEVLKDTVSDLSELILGSQYVPLNILMPLYNRSIRPLNFDLESNKTKTSWNKVLETTASLFKANDPNIQPILDDNLNDRGYLLGRLLAIANQVETEVLQKEDSKNKTYTNAQRSMTKIPEDPMFTWQNIYIHLEHYLEKYDYANKARRLINHITRKLASNSRDYKNLNIPFNLKEKGRFIIGLVQQKYAWFDSEYKYTYKTDVNYQVLPIKAREYLLGRLLAIADSFEYKILKENVDEDHPKIVTNAERYLNYFVQRPLDTWQTIYLHLLPYLSKEKNYRQSLIKIDNAINLLKVDKNNINELNKPLKGKFLIGFSQEKYERQKIASEEISLNKDLTNRSYLYGRLLAVADIVELQEQRIHQIERPTNAMRYLSAFSQSPTNTWPTIWKNVEKYVKSMDNYSQAKDLLTKIIYQLKEIPNFENQREQPLDGMFLLGFSQQKFAWYNRTKERN